MAWGFGRFKPDLSEVEELQLEKKLLERETAEKKLQLKRLRRQRKQKRENAFKTKVTRLPARVERVNIAGLGRTKDDLVQNKVLPLFNVTNFREFIQITKHVHRELKNVGCFRSVNIFIDTAERSTPTRPLYQVNITVEEAGRLFGNAGLVQGIQETELSGVLRGGLSNLFGGGERLEGEVSRGISSSSFSSSSSSAQTVVTLLRPLQGWWWNDADGFVGGGSRVGVALVKSKNRLEHAPVSQESLGVRLESVLKLFSVSLTSRLGLFNMVDTVDWTRLKSRGGLHRYHPVMEDCGSHLLPTLHNTLQLDMLDSSLLPTHGLKLTLSHTAGLSLLSRRTAFQQFMCYCSAYLPISSSFSVGLSGLLSHTLGPERPPLALLLLGPESVSASPLVLRGRNNPPHWRGDISAIALNLSFVSKLPLLTSNSLLGKHIRFHGFVTSFATSSHAGQLPQVVSCWNRFHTHVGLGLLTKISDMCRVELNYCLPLQSAGATQGLSFSIGTTFL